MNAIFHRLLACALLLVPAYGVQGAVDMFFTMDGVPGESMVPGYEGWIEIQSWHTDILVPTKIAPGGGGQPAGGGKPSIGSLTFTKAADSTTAIIYSQCCNGTHIPEAKLVVRKAGGDPVEYIVIEMKNLSYASVGTVDPTEDETGEEQLIEKVTLNFGEIKWDYVPQKPDGSEGPPLTMEWSGKKGEK